MGVTTGSKLIGIILPESQRAHHKKSELMNSSELMVYMLTIISQFEHKTGCNYH